MRTSSHLVLYASAIAATALLIVGCTASTGEQHPTRSATPDDSDNAMVSPIGDDVEATWLDEGRMFAIVTRGSSSCVPVVDEVSAEGQTVRVSLVDTPGDAAENGGEGYTCTDDFTTRASVGAIPEGVDPTRDVELIVTAGDVTEDVDLDGNAAFTGIPGDSTEYAPSAGWFDDDGVVLLTWGSSSCPPIVENVVQEGAGATVAFRAEERVCTMDMAPRATVIDLTVDDDDIDDDGAFTLTLVGGGLDATVDVPRG